MIHQQPQLNPHGGSATDAAMRRGCAKVATLLLGDPQDLTAPLSVDADADHDRDLHDSRPLTDLRGQRVRGP